jgi:hypothetical protein
MIMGKLEWNKNIFGTRLSLTRDSELIGSIIWPNVFSNKAIARILDKEFILNRDLLASRIEIFDAKDQSFLGRLSVNIFNPQSEVVINGKRFELEMKNFWQSGWAWKFNGSDIVTFTSNEFLIKDRGEIELFVACNEEVEILILLGLVLRNYFTLIIVLLLLLAIIILI